MFLVAITHKSIASGFADAQVERARAGSQQVTLVTDHFLSRADVKAGGFSVIESAMLDSPAPRDNLFSEISYEDRSGAVQIAESTLSGRPIYYSATADGGFFCSTHIAMLRKAGCPIEENHEAMPEYFVYGNIMPPHTLYKNVFRFEKGARMRFKFIHGRWEAVEEERYSFPIPSAQNGAVHHSSQRTRELLERSIQSLKPGKDKLAVLLSGGMDSSILFKICQRQLDVNASYSTAFPFERPEKNREKRYAQTAAEAMGSRHRYYEPTTRDYLFGVIEAIQAAEEPVYHLQSVLLFLLYKQLPQSEQIIVCGEGADCLFGTTTHNRVFTKDRWFFNLLAASPSLKMIRLLHGMTHKGKRFVDLFTHINRRTYPISDPNSILWTKGTWGSEDWTTGHFDISRQDLFRARYSRIREYEDRSLYDLFAIHDFLSSITNTQSVWAKLGESQDKILFYPFLDEENVRHALSIPWKDKLKHPKNILRGVARQLDVPDFIVHRSKGDFGITPERWSERGGVFEPLIPLAAKVFDRNEMVRMQYTQDRMQEFSNKKARIFWNILNYAIWKRLHIDHEPLDRLFGELEEVLYEKGMG